MADTDFVTALVGTLQTPGAGNAAALKAAVTATVLSNAGGSAAVWIVTGDMEE